MALKTQIENLNRARAEYETQIAALGSDVQKGIAELLAANIPAGFVLQWTAGTPSFNDGDPCRFELNDPIVVKIDSENKDDDEEEGYVPEYVEDTDNSLSLSSWSIDTYGADIPEHTETFKNGRTFTHQHRDADPELEGLPRATALALYEIWKSLPKDMLEKAFGDPHMVMVKSDGTFEVGYYDPN